MRFLRLALFVVFALPIVTLLAQTSFTSVRGTIADNSGAMIPNAQVSLKNTATNAELTGSTDSAGLFQFPQVTPGTYTIRYSIAGAGGCARPCAVSLAADQAHVATTDTVLCRESRPGLPACHSTPPITVWAEEPPEAPMPRAPQVRTHRTFSSQAGPKRPARAELHSLPETTGAHFPRKLCHGGGLRYAV